MAGRRSNQQTAELFGFGRLFELTYEAVVGADLITETIVLWNPGAERMFGYTAEEAVGMPLERLVPPEMVEAHHTGIRRFREGGAPRLVGGEPAELPAITKDGLRLTIALSLTAIPTGADDSHVVAVIRDVSARKQAELELLRANQTMKDFVATASHELRTPLTAVVGFGELMRERAISLSDGEIMEYAEVVVRAARQANRLVDNLLTVSKIQAELIEACPAEWRLAALLPEVMARSGIEIDTAFHPHLSVFADRDHVVVILSNLVGNAVKHGRGPVQLEAGREGPMVQIRVRDYGSGVPEEFRPRLFESFARQGGPGRADGTGLGLAIVRGLARANGGDAFYEPAPDGSIFGVTLPAAPG